MLKPRLCCRVYAAGVWRYLGCSRRYGVECRCSIPYRTATAAAGSIVDAVLSGAVVLEVCNSCRVGSVNALGSSELEASSRAGCVMRTPSRLRQQGKSHSPAAAALSVVHRNTVHCEQRAIPSRQPHNSCRSYQHITDPLAAWHRHGADSTTLHVALSHTM